MMNCDEQDTKASRDQKPETGRMRLLSIIQKHAAEIGPDCLRQRWFRRKALDWCLRMRLNSRAPPRTGLSWRIDRRCRAVSRSGAGQIYPGRFGNLHRPNRVSKTISNHSDIAPGWPGLSGHAHRRIQLFIRFPLWGVLIGITGSWHRACRATAISQPHATSATTRVVPAAPREAT